MTIDWVNFTPWHALAGGLLIGLAASLFILFFGRVMGISGIVGGLLKPTTGDIAWRIAFVLGIFAAPWVWLVFAEPVPVTIEADTTTLVIAGLLVGLGTRLANGCTSGHGVCGISRLSLRGIAATFAYLLAGGVIMVAARHWLGII